MQNSLLPFLSCPECTQDLEIARADSSTGDDILDGALRCVGCRKPYPIENGIPCLMHSQLLDPQKEEIVARDAQVSDYDAMLFLRVFGLVEMPMTLRRLDLRPGDFLLEAGCGTGRMTAALGRRVREVAAVDFSYESLMANAEKLRALGIHNVHLVQADLCHLPFKTGTFDRLLSCQVLEHIPTPGAREMAVEALGRVVRPGGVAVISAYQNSVWTRQKQGAHKGGIPFFRFTRAEFESLLGYSFRVQSVTGSLVYLYLARCGREA